MSLRRLRIVECDVPGCLASSAEDCDLGTLTLTADEQRRGLKLEGWTRRDGKDYCTECVDDAIKGDKAIGAVRSCRKCGCIDARACAGGCWWVAADLCSACVA